MLRLDVIDGRPCAIKTNISVQEEKNNILIQELKSIAPPVIAAHLPEIYSVNNSTIIMEKLSPHQHGKKPFLDFGFWEKSEQAKLLKEPAFIEVAVQSVFKDHRLSELTAIFKENLKPFSAENSGFEVQKIFEILARRFKKDQAIPLSAVHKVIFNIASYSIIPGSHEIYFYGSSPLIDTLLWLKDHGLPWQDLHSDNLMSRAGQDVLIDFEFYGCTDVFRLSQ